jgi:hypothetical protein
MTDPSTPPPQIHPTPIRCPPAPRGQRGRSIFVKHTNPTDFGSHVSPTRQVPLKNPQSKCPPRPEKRARSLSPKVQEPLKNPKRKCPQRPEKLRAKSVPVVQVQELNIEEPCLDRASSVSPIVQNDYTEWVQPTRMGSETEDYRVPK